MATGTGAPPSAAETERARAISAALTAMLNPVPGSRKVLPHLAAVEADLPRHGLVVLGKVSTPTLVKLAQELATLPVAANNTALHDLQALLLGELDARSRPRREFLSTFVATDRLEVSEGSHTDFMNVAGLDKPGKPGA